MVKASANEKANKSVYRSFISAEITSKAVAEYVISYPQNTTDKAEYESLKKSYPSYCILR